VAELIVRGVDKAFGPVRALVGVSLSVPAGAVTAVLGPSGCGKTTLLRCVAGFERVDSGEILVGGRAVTAVPPHRRRIAVVPQEAALFPHLSVFDNVAYGLARGAGRTDRVEAILALVGLSGYEGRMPHQLSGGQQQRVAVARALAPRPPLVLLDEPFSALDAALRADVRHDVREALRADGATAVLVTHDQGEALSMADEVAVMRAGQIVQSGSPAEVYATPADEWVASFVGEAVLLSVREVAGGLARTVLGDLPVGPSPAVPATVMLRPEQLEVRPANGTAGVRARVVRRDYHGHDSLVTLRLGDGTEVMARLLGTEPGVVVDAEVSLYVRGAARLVTTARPTG
jgi:iron(III) transport system ATP-binding protein